MDNWMKVIFIEESRICIGQSDDARTFIWCRSNETYKDNCQKISKFPKLFIIWGFISFKEHREMVIIISTINTHVHIETLHNFLISLIKNWFGVDELIFRDDNASWHGAKGIKPFSLGKAYEINNITSEQSGCKFNWKFMLEF